MPARKVGYYFDTHPPMQALIKEAARLVKMQQVLIEIAPQPFARSGHVGRFTHGSLLLFADNGAVAAKLRQLAPSLLIKFQTRGYEVTVIRVQVQPPARTALPHKNIRLSRKAAGYVQELAANLPPTPLRAALEKLAARPSNHDNQPLQDEKPQYQGDQNQEKFE
jgi:hypothetical protein